MATPKLNAIDEDEGSYCPKCAEPTGMDAHEFWEERGSQGIFVCPHCKARLVAGWDDYESPNGWWAFELAKECVPVADKPST